MSESYDSGRWGPPPEDRRSPKVSRRKLAVFAAVAVALVAFVALVVAPPLREDAAREQRAAAAAQARLEAAERARLIREGRPVRTRVAAEAERPALVTAAEAAITRDARARVASGEIKGKVEGTHCRPFPYTVTRARQERDLSIERNRYQCVAYSSRFALPELEGRKRTGVFGTPYWLIAEYATGRLMFCKISPKAGEGGKVLVEVQADPACGDPL
jgi:hypothetical protein